MNWFVVLSFPDQVKTDEAIRALRKLHSEGNVKLHASAVVARDFMESYRCRRLPKKDLVGRPSAL